MQQGFDDLLADTTLVTLQLTAEMHKLNQLVLNNNNTCPASNLYKYKCIQQLHVSAAASSCTHPQQQPLKQSEGAMTAGGHFWDVECDQWVG